MEARRDLQPLQANSERILLFKQWIDHGLWTGQLAVESGMIGGNKQVWSSKELRVKTASYALCHKHWRGHDCSKTKNTEEKTLSKAMTEQLAQLKSGMGKKNDFEAENRVSE